MGKTLDISNEERLRRNNACKKAYILANPDRVKALHLQRVDCPICEKSVRKYALSKHEKTLKHQIKVLQAQIP